jgi:hypothetical protein
MKFQGYLEMAEATDVVYRPTSSGMFYWFPRNSLRIFENQSLAEFYEALAGRVVDRSDSVMIPIFVQSRLARAKRS